MNQVIYSAQNGGSIFAGQFNYFAGIKFGDGSGSMTDVIMDANPENMINAICVNDNMVYAVGNTHQQAEFAGQVIQNTGVQESFILAAEIFGGLQSIAPAGAKGFSSANDIVMDANENLWVAGQFDEEISKWSDLNSSVKTGFVLNFNRYLDPLNSFSVKGTMTEANALVLATYGNMVLVGGEFKGGVMAIGNNDNGYTNNSLITGAPSVENFWFAQIEMNQNQFSWIEGSYSLEPIHLTDISYDGLHTILTGSYVDDINNTTATLAYKGIDRISGSNPLGFAFRGGDLNGSKTPKYYKTNKSAGADPDLGDDAIDLLGSTLNVFPNPNSGMFYVNYISNSTGNLKITLHDVTGKKVFYQEFEKAGNHFENKLSPGQLPNGIYLLSAELNDKIEYQKIVIQ